MLLCVLWLKTFAKLSSAGHLTGGVMTFPSDQSVVCKDLALTSNRKVCRCGVGWHTTLAGEWEILCIVIETRFSNVYVVDVINTNARTQVSQQHLVLSRDGRCSSFVVLNFLANVVQANVSNVLNYLSWRSIIRKSHFSLFINPQKISRI